MRGWPLGSNSTSGIEASSFVAGSVEHELEHDTLSAYLYALDEEFDPVPSDLSRSTTGYGPS